MTYTIEKITTLIGARRYGDTDMAIGWLLTDSRSLCFPEQTLFFALRTQRNDGHRYIDDLYRRGVRAFVVEQLPDGYAERYGDANFLRVPSPLAALQRLAPSSALPAATARRGSRSGSTRFSPALVSHRTIILRLRTIILKLLVIISKLRTTILWLLV